MLTEDEVRELRRLEAAAVRAPWFSDDNYVNAKRREVSIACCFVTPSSKRDVDIRLLDGRAHAALVAAARNALPRLLDERDELRAVVAWLVRLSTTKSAVSEWDDLYARARKALGEPGASPPGNIFT